MPDGQVRDAHGRVGRVDALAAGAGRSVDVDLQVPLVDIHLDLLGFGHDGHGRRRRVDATLGLGGRHALDAVRPRLPLEDRVRAVALDGEDRLLDATALVRACRDLLPFEATPFRVAREHAEDVAGPERRLVAPHSLAHLDDDVLRVGGIPLDQRELQLLLDLGRASSSSGTSSRRSPSSRAASRSARAPAPLLGELEGPLELLQPAPGLGRLLVIVVDGRVGHALLRLAVGALQLVDECREIGHDTRLDEGIEGPDTLAP